VDELGAISETEFRVLEVLWEYGPATVRRINERLPRWAYTTVQTLLARLEKKGYVTCDRSGFAHVFRYEVSRDGLLRRRLGELVEKLAGGIATPLVLALVEDHKFSAEDIDQLQELIDRLAAEHQRKARGGGTTKNRGRKTLANKTS